MTLIAHRGAQMMDRQALMALPIPEATRTHQPVPHHQIIEALVQTLGFRHINVVGEEYAATPDGAKMFGVLDLDYEFTGCRFSIGIRNANDKSMRLALTVGYRVFVCDNMAFQGDFMPLLAKHSKGFDLYDSISIGVDKMQRNFEPLKQSVFDWQARELTDNEAKLVIYEAFIDGNLDVPRMILPDVHEHYFNPKYDSFKERTLWSLSNAFTSSFKGLKPFQQFKATAKLSPFLNRFK